MFLALPACLALSAGSVVAQDDAQLSKRAKALGSFAYLPKSTEGGVSIRNLNGMFQQIVDSKFFGGIMELTGAAGDESEAIIEMIQGGLATYAGEEITIAYSEGSAAEVKRLMSLYDLYVRMSYGALGKGLSSGDLSSGGMGPEMMMGLLKKGLADPESGLSKALDEIQMPPMLIGSKMDAGAAEGIVAMLGELEQNLPPFIVVKNFDVEGFKFKSWSVKLADVFDENMQGEMEDAIGDKELSDRLAKAIRSKRFEFSFGSIEDHFVAGLGPNNNHLKFVDNPAESVASLPMFAKLDPYLDKPIHGLAFAKKSLLAAEDQNQLMEAMVDSFVDGLTSEGSGTMKKIGKKLKKIGGNMMTLNESKASDYVGIMYGGDGLNGESFGGWMLDSIDGKAKLKFANAGLDDAFIILDSATKAKYNKVGIEMLETLASLVPLGAKAYGEMSGDEDGVEQFMQMQKMFGPKLDKIWTITRDKFFAGLGQESATIIDLNGSIPKIPGVPRVMLNNGRAPRIAMANTVKNRKMLTEAWEEMVPAMNDLFASIPNQGEGREFQMPDTLSSDGPGIKTHFFGMPFASNDFLPSLSINDKLFFLSTSKKFSEGIAAKVAKGKGDIRGLYVKVNFSELNGFIGDWLQMVLENKDTVFAGNEFAAEDFEEGAEIGKHALRLGTVLQSFEYNKYTDDSNGTRSSWHLHLKDVK